MALRWHATTVAAAAHWDRRSPVTARRGGTNRGVEWREQDVAKMLTRMVSTSDDHSGGRTARAMTVMMEQRVPRDGEESTG